MGAADLVGGRTISMHVYVRLTPTGAKTVGTTDAAWEIGRGLIREATLLLKNAGEAEGFVVTIDAQQVVY